MSGQGNIQFTRKVELPASGAPFTPGSAGNGLSIDGATGRVFLGGTPLEQLTLIPLNGFPLQIIDTNNVDTWILIDPVNNQMILGTQGADPAFIGITNLPGNQTIALTAGFSEILMDRTGIMIIGNNVSQNGTKILLDDNTGTVDIRNTALTAGLSINGNPGATGTFTTVDLKTVTVSHGLIVSIV